VSSVDMELDVVKEHGIIMDTGLGSRVGIYGFAVSCQYNHEAVCHSSRHKLAVEQYIKRHSDLSAFAYYIWMQSEPIESK